MTKFISPQCYYEYLDCSSHRLLQTRLNISIIAPVLDAYIYTFVDICVVSALHRCAILKCFILHFSCTFPV